MRTLLIIALVAAGLWWSLTPQYDLEISQNGRDYHIVKTGLTSLDGCRDAVKSAGAVTDYVCLKWTRFGKWTNQHSPYNTRER